jgi:hypothetical protein
LAAAEQSAVVRSEADGADEMVDLAVSLAVDDAARLALGCTACRAGQPTSGVAVLDRLDVPEIACEPVEL